MQVMGYGDRARIILSKSELAMLEMIAHLASDDHRYEWHQGVRDVIDEFLTKVGVTLDNEQ